MNEMLFSDLEPDVDPYRFRLVRSFGSDARIVLFCMLNPSTADAVKDDPTIRRCIGFAKAWDYTELRVVNLFAARATDPKALKDMVDPLGPYNDEYVANEIEMADLLVAAWGATGGFVKRKRVFVDRFGHHEWMCLGHTSAGHPVHPLYQPKDAELIRFDTSRWRTS